LAIGSLGGVGVAAVLASAALFRQLYKLATYGYDGKEYKGADLQPITPNDRFYVVSKNNIDPHVKKDWWQLEITGQVERPRTYRFEDVIALPSVMQETTLQCISNSIGGGLMSNAIWKGVPLRTLLEAAGPKAGVTEVVCRSVDGYTDDLPLEKAMDPTTLLTYEMNGVSLPRNHGYPARILAPGMVGEKSVKWVTRIELNNQDTKQFYEKQGWGPNFVLHTHSRIDVPDFKEPMPLGSLIVLKGVAFAGNRGVDRVEISFDDARTWQETELTYKNSRLA
jgi:DMSO/TMAO reductase YedYZ molybdopterin-dependent catalytic subunit